MFGMECVKVPRKDMTLYKCDESPRSSDKLTWPVQVGILFLYRYAGKEMYIWTRGIMLDAYVLQHYILCL